MPDGSVKQGWVDYNSPNPKNTFIEGGTKPALSAKDILEFRDKNGQFRTREQLKKVPRFGDKTFELAAGFLRVQESENPLDASAVHPESYALVEEIARRHGRNVKSLIGDGAFLRSLNAKDYISEKYGLPTVLDILRELEKPGRDPRGAHP